MENLNSDEKKKIIDTMINDQNVRKTIVNESLSWFFYCYFAHYIKYEMATFHREMFKLAEDETINNVVITAFRGSAKSTIFTLAFPIWAILGKQQKKHILILSGTQHKSQQILQNIKREFETNTMLQSDLGPFKEERNEWNITSLYIPKYDAKITCGSVDQSIRSIRFKEYRPQLILLDDIEDLESVRTKESRDNIENWLMGEVIPAGEISTRMILIGNLLHNDSVIKRLQKRIEEGRMNGKFLSIPIIDRDGKSTWLGKYPDQTAIDTERMKGLSEIAWRREYMLEIIPDEAQIIREDMIQRYAEIPPFETYTNYRGAVTGTDLAISEKESADYTTAVSVQIFGHGDERKIYVLPYTLNERLDAPKALERIGAISRELGSGIPTLVFVEDVGYQRSFAQLLKEKDIPAEPVSIHGHDKYSRLKTIAPLIQSGSILFPQHGCEELLTQMIGFGVEKHDDLVDALTLLILKLIKDDSEGGRILVPAPEPENNSPKIESAQDFRDKPDLAAQLEKKAEMDFYNEQMQRRIWG